MYQSDNKTNYVKILLRIILFVLLVLLTIKLFSLIINNKKRQETNNKLESNLTILQDTGVKYFNDNNIKLDAGKNKVIYLNELLDNNLINELKDEHDNTCSKDETYIEILRLQNEYRIKSYLVCGDNKSDKYIYIDAETRETIKDQEPTSEIVIPVTTETTKTTTTTTKKVTTTKKTTTSNKTTKATTKQTTKQTSVAQDEYYYIGFNTNGGEILNKIKVKKGESVTLPTPVRNGYTFYRWIDSSNNVYSGTITPTKNLVLIAKWR